MKKKLHLKEGIKTALIITCIYLLFIMYLLIASNRINGLDENSYTKDGHNRSITLIK